MAGHMSASRVVRELFRTLTVVASAAVVVSSSGCGSGEDQRKTIVLYGFSIMEDSMKEDIIPAFQKSWRARTGRMYRSSPPSRVQAP